MEYDLYQFLKELELRKNQLIIKIHKQKRELQAVQLQIGLQEHLIEVYKEDTDV